MQDPARIGALVLPPVVSGLVLARQMDLTEALELSLAQGIGKGLRAARRKGAQRQASAILFIQHLDPQMDPVLHFIYQITHRICLCFQNCGRVFIPALFCP